MTPASQGAPPPPPPSPSARARTRAWARGSSRTRRPPRRRRRTSPKDVPRGPKFQAPDAQLAAAVGGSCARPQRDFPRILPTGSIISAGGPRRGRTPSRPRVEEQVPRRELERDARDAPHVRGVPYFAPKITSGLPYCRVWMSCVNCLYVQHALPNHHPAPHRPGTAARRDLGCATAPTPTREVSRPPCCTEAASRVSPGGSGSRRRTLRRRRRRFLRLLLALRRWFFVAPPRPARRRRCPSSPPPPPPSRLRPRSPLGAASASSTCARASSRPPRPRPIPVVPFLAPGEPRRRAFSDEVGVDDLLLRGGSRGRATRPCTPP